MVDQLLSNTTLATIDAHAEDDPIEPDQYQNRWGDPIPFTGPYFLHTFRFPD